MDEKKLIDTAALSTTVRRVRADYLEKISEATSGAKDVVTDEELSEMLDEIFGTAEESAEA